MLADFFRAFVKCTYQSPDALLMELSARYVTAAKELGLHHVPQFFAIKHGRLSSDHYRTLAHVFEVIICDFDDDAEVKQAVHDMLVWYWASRSTCYDAAYIENLRELGLRMRASMAFFETDELRAMYHLETKVHVSSLDDVPKMHRATVHLPNYLSEFGPFEDLTTEASEAANKPLKQIFRTYVPVCVRVCAYASANSIPVCAMARACMPMRVLACQPVRVCACLPQRVDVCVLICVCVYACVSNPLQGVRVFVLSCVRACMY